MTAHAATIDPTFRGLRDAPLLRRAVLLAGLFGRAMRATHAWEAGSLDPEAAAAKAFHAIAD